MLAAPDIQRDLILVGGGHTHALALRMLSMRPIGGLRITLISTASHTPYSGMLPGLIAGHYTFEQAHIDLARLCQWSGVRFICGEVNAIDPIRQTVSLHGRPSIEYDVLSIDVGSQPELDSVPGARSYSVPVKPVAGLWQRWGSLREKLQLSCGGSAHRVAMVGGGAGSVELIAAMARHFSASDRVAAQQPSFALFCGGSEILLGYNARARRSVESALRAYGIELHLNSRVESVESGTLVVSGGVSYGFDELFWCTGAVGASWLADSGLACDPRGFLAVGNTLQTHDYANIFAAGDCATQVDQPRPKAGVYAVRQAPVLAENLRSYLLGRSLKKHIPQRQFLSLLSLGAKRATADRGILSATGEWVWQWKDKIDREFMARFEDLPKLMGGEFADSLPRFEAVEPQAPCGGCGAKVGADTLSTVLRELAAEYPVHCPGSEGAEDTVVIPASSTGPTVQSVDTLRQIVADPWLMGRIAANHALSDLYACGAAPLSALASLALPFAPPEILQRELRQLLAGALHEFSLVECKLLGGHTMQGPELSVGFVVNGAPAASEAGLLAKRGAHSGDHLVLTKPLGIGTLFASNMQLTADGRHIQSAIEMMLQSNAAAGELAMLHRASACTDVTGFGLLGHLVEMLVPGQGADLQLAQIPALPGAIDALSAGIRSTMHAANERAVANAVEAEITGGPEFDLLFDPQTSGGLLIAIAANRSAGLCEDLVQAGYSCAVVIGEVQPTAVDQQTTVTLSPA